MSSLLCHYGEIGLGEYVTIVRLENRRWVKYEMMLFGETFQMLFYFSCRVV